MGEAAGGSELIAEALHAVAHAWTGRGPATSLSQALAAYAGAASAEDLLDWKTFERIKTMLGNTTLLFRLEKN